MKHSTDLPLEVLHRIATSSSETWRAMTLAVPNLGRMSLRPNVQKELRERFSNVERRETKSGTLVTVQYPDSSGWTEQRDLQGRLLARKTVGPGGEFTIDLYDAETKTSSMHYDAYGRLLCYEYPSGELVVRPSLSTTHKLARPGYAVLLGAFAILAFVLLFRHLSSQS